eukprot:TRINITY_DN112359_c0_g1_i1.p1 TRINITY_DN112359_c0_g1~~TRINITY_DN112359_c0_g1_i1.p1  ORF type:complete len:109 (+),score=7.54 TRINITY_DN112359_c0_g1_i1:68-394(+)
MMSEAVGGSPKTTQELEKECQEILFKTRELEGVVAEHNLVLQTFEDVEESRRCFRLLGGVLVERTVAEVRPQIQDTVTNAKTAITALESQFLQKRAKLSERVGSATSS